jgi:AcrR family transcriptional regulator
VASVVEAVSVLAEERGVHALTMSALAQRAGVSVASLYEYFPTKDAVLAAWAERVWERALNAGFVALERSVVQQRLPVDQGAASVLLAVNAELRPFARAIAGVVMRTVVGRYERREELIETVRFLILGVITGAPDAGVRVNSPETAANLVAHILCSDGYLNFLATASNAEDADTEVCALFRRYLRGDDA